MDWFGEETYGSRCPSPLGAALVRTAVQFEYNVLRFERFAATYPRYTTTIIAS